MARNEPDLSASLFFPCDEQGVAQGFKEMQDGYRGAFFVSPYILSLRPPFGQTHLEHGDFLDQHGMWVCVWLGAVMLG